MSTTRTDFRMGHIRPNPDEDQPPATARMSVYTHTGQARWITLDRLQLAALLHEAAETLHALERARPGVGSSV